MTPETAARIHAQAFPQTPWSAAEIARLGAAPGFMVSGAQGFALGRVIVGEAELLTLATAPASRRRGQGRALLEMFQDAARERGATRAFLEVAADNTPARALYDRAGWQVCAIRKGYYRRDCGARADAIIMERALSAK